MSQATRLLAGFLGVREAISPSGVTPVALNRYGFIKPLAAIVTRWNLYRLSGTENRKLEIGPGPRRTPGFETLNITPGLEVDYVWDATRKLPFPSGTFTLIYASHILEHVPWYKTGDVLREWVRILRPGGSLEVWVPNGLKICQAFVDAETAGLDPLENDPWTRFNEERDPCKWASGRLFTYGDGTGAADHPNWHRAVFSPRYLKKLMEEAGLVNVVEMERQEVRGYDHGWINLGMKGSKPAPPRASPARAISAQRAPWTR